VLTTMAALLLVMGLIEAAYLYLGRLDRHRAEAAYWAAKADRPALYDWSKDPEL